MIETQGEAVQIVNDTYALESTDVTLEEAAPTLMKGAVQSRGFVIGSPVLAVGFVAQQTRGLVAELLYAGTHSGYVSYLTRSLRNARWREFSHCLSCHLFGWATVTSFFAL
jgi:hypothetical protein